jgi:hypothetical protein
MRSRDWFSLGVRLLGVWVLYRAVGDLLVLGSSVLGLSPESSLKQWNDTHTMHMYNMWYAVGYLAFAIYLMLGAEHLTRWVYSEPSPQRDSVDDGATEPG